MHHFDVFGWYTSTPIPGRATDIEPPIDSETTEPGELRANWQGRHWEEWPYAPPPADEPPPVPVPASITRAQGKAALIGAALWPAVLAFVADIEDDTQRALAEVALHDTLEWRRDSPFLTAAAAGLGLTPEQLDGLFIGAAEILL